MVAALLLGCPGKGSKANKQSSNEKLQHDGLDWISDPIGERLLLSSNKNAFIGGEKVRILVTKNSKQFISGSSRREQLPVSGVLVRLADQEAKTDASGVVIFDAPVNEFPTTYRVGAYKDGYAFLDSFSLNGELRYAPGYLAVTVLLPAHASFSLPPDVEDRLSRIRILDTTWLSDIEKKALLQKLEGTDIEIDEDSGWDEEDILEDLSDAGWDDIWVFHGHSNGMAMGDDDDNAVTGDEMCEALRKDNDPPSIIVLSGCATSRLAGQLCACGAKIVIGYSETCYIKNASSATEQFLEALLDGKTLSEGVMAASGELNGSSGPGTATICQGGGSNINVDSSKLGDALYRKPTITKLLEFIMHASQDGKAYETLAKAKLTDIDGNNLAGKSIAFFVDCELGRSLNTYAIEVDAVDTDGQGLATSKLWRIAQLNNQSLVCKMDASFRGDAEYKASMISDSKYIH